MLTLVEPIVTDRISDRPHLGCAMLIAACQEKGIKTTLINGQTRYLKDMFINDSQELWGLMQDIKNNNLKNKGINNDLIEAGIPEYEKFIKNKDMGQFRDELKSLYQNVIIDKNPRRYFNAQMISKFDNFHNVFMAMYLYYIKELNYRKLKIIDRYISEIIKSNPRYIGFSLEGKFEHLSRAIRKRIRELTKIPIIVGGSLTPFLDTKEIGKIFEKEYFDYLVIGPGEEALPRLLESIENNKEPLGIPNIVYRKNGKIRINKLEVINKLDNLPYPDYSQFDLDLYLTPKRILPLQTARGCSWKKCAFCSYYSFYLGNYNTYSIEKVIDIIKRLQNAYSCNHFAFHDEELPPGRAKIISKAILNSSLKNICINTYARPVEGYNNGNILRLMRKAGFTLIHWGVEAGSQKVLNLMNKGTRVLTISQVLRKSSKNQIANLCFIMFGFPGETVGEARQTLEFLRKHAEYIEDVLSGSFHLDLCSPIGKWPKKWGVNVKGGGGYSVKSGMNPKEVEAFHFKFNVNRDINRIKVTSNKLHFFPPLINKRMSYFLISSYKLCSETILLRYLKKGKLSDIFPIILGEIKKEGNKTIFLPVNINKTYCIMQMLPEKEMVLDNLEENIFILSDGRLSIKDIASSIYKDSKRSYTKQYIDEKCKKFYLKIFSENWGLGFAKSWQ